MKFIDYFENMDVYAEALRAFYDDRNYLNWRINDAASKKQAPPKKAPFSLHDCVYRHTTKIRPKLRRLINRVARHSVSICIPTYRETKTLYKAVDSAVGQRKVAKLEVLIVVNCGNREWANKIEARYAQTDCVRVVFTEKKGVSAARNVGIEQARHEYITFLDDDDYLTEGFIASLTECIRPDADFVCGWYSTKGSKKDKTKYEYTNTALKALRKTGRKNPRILGVFGNVNGKLFRRSFLEACTKFHEEMRSSEDIVFWAENYELVRERIASPFASCKEKYVRVVSDDSMSRPSTDELFNFYINERLEVIGKLEKALFERTQSKGGNEFVLGLIKAQEGMIVNYYKGLNGDLKAKARECIKKCDCLLVNKGQFAERVALAFCHNFSPAIDPSAMVAAKRLRQLEEYFDELLEWHVFSKGMSDIRKSDPLWNEYYVKPLISSNEQKLGRTYENPRAQVFYAVESYIKANPISASYVYSRSAFPGSHIAAGLYKKNHPEAMWIAEFSDPIALNSSGGRRSAAYANSEFEEFFEACEIIPYRYADKLIFTNSVQRDYMLGYCKDREAAALAASKALVWHHPIIDKRYVHLFRSNYKLPSDKINIGYFGSFYARRSVDPIRALAKRSDVLIHLFVPKMNAVPKGLPSNVRVNAGLPYFEFLDAASKMDYVFLSDMEPLNGVTPWLPSKLSDYLAAGTPVIALCNDGSALQMYESDEIIKLANISDEFLTTLKKKDA